MLAPQDCWDDGMTRAERQAQRLALAREAASPLPSAGVARRNSSLSLSHQDHTGESRMFK